MEAAVENSVDTAAGDTQTTEVVVNASESAEAASAEGAAEAAAAESKMEAATAETDKPAAAEGADEAAAAVKPGSAQKKAETPKTGRKLRKDEVKEGLAVQDVKSAEALRHEHATAMGGYLQKRSDQGLFKNWKKRWVMLVGSLLYYFESEESKNPQGALARWGDRSLCSAISFVPSSPHRSCLARCGPPRPPPPPLSRRHRAAAGRHDPAGGAGAVEGEARVHRDQVKDGARLLLPGQQRRECALV